MMDAVRAALEERDLLLFVVDATKPFHEDDRRAVDLFRKRGTPAVLVLNKIDLLKDKAQLLAADRAVQERLRVRRLPAGLRREGPRTGRTPAGDRDAAAGGPGLLSRRPCHRSARALSGGELIREKILPADAPGGAALRRRHGGQMGRDAAYHAHLRHHPGGARRAEGAS